MQPKTRNRIAGVMLTVLFAFTGTGMTAVTAMAACDANSSWHNEYSCDGQLVTSGSCSSSMATNPGGGKVFSGWDCSYSHDGSYAGESCYHFYRCTSKWTTPPTPTYYPYSLRVYGNGGSIPSDGPTDRTWTSTSTSSSFSYTIPSGIPTRDGYEFKGWHYKTGSSQPTGNLTANKQPGDSITVTYSDASLTAVWQVKPSDKTKPTISGATDTSITVGDQFDPKQGVTANDDTDGDITANIKITGTVDATKPGVYELTYTVHDQAGNEASVKRTITVNPVMSASMPETGMGGGLRIR